MEEIIAFISRYDRDYRSKIKRASQDEITYMEQLAKQPLPDCYRRFLQTMGKGMGGLETDGLSFRIDDLIDIYKHRDEAEMGWPDRFLLIAEHEQDPYFHYYMNLSAEHEPGDYKIVRFYSESETDDVGEGYYVADSLKELLVQAAFAAKLRDIFPCVEKGTILYPGLRAGETGQTALDHFEEIVLITGFQRIAAISRNLLVAEKSDICLYAKGSVPGSVIVTIRGQDQQELRTLLKTFAAHTVPG